ncbi:MAG: hypothetical protein ACE5NW_03700 [Acidiferrobacterales bacterium]
MIFRVLIGAGLLALGYYVGREIGRSEPIREELRKARDEEKRERRPQEKADKS